MTGNAWKHLVFKLLAYIEACASISYLVCLQVDVCASTWSSGLLR
jgi:hypothetical protein